MQVLAKGDSARRPVSGAAILCDSSLIVCFVLRRYTFNSQKQFLLNGEFKFVSKRRLEHRVITFFSMTLQARRSHMVLGGQARLTYGLLGVG